MAEFVKHRRIAARTPGASATFGSLGAFARRAFRHTSVVRIIVVFGIAHVPCSGTWFLAALLGYGRENLVVSRSRCKERLHEVHFLHFIVVEKRQHDVYRLYLRIFKHARLEHAEFYNAVGYIGHRKVARRTSMVA